MLFVIITCCDSVGVGKKAKVRRRRKECYNNKVIERIKKGFNRLRKKRDLTIGSISKNIWIIALPLILTNGFESAFNLVDMFWVGKLGPEALAAVSMSGTVIMLILFLLIGVSMGTVAMVARFIGAKKDEDANNVAIQSLILATFLAVFLSVIGYILSPHILKALKADPTVLILGTSYMRILFIWVIIMVYMFFMSAILQGAGDAFTPMLVLGLATLLNLVLDPFLIFGWGPFPRMGVDGAAWSTVIARAVGSFIALYVLFKGHSHIKIKLRKPDFSIIFRILKIGIPASMQYILRGSMGIIIMSIVAGFGTFAVAAYGVGIRLTMLVMMPGFAFAAAAQTLVGQNLGAKNPARSARSAWTAFFFYSIFMLLMSILFYSFSSQVFAFFSNNKQVVEIGNSFLKIVALSFVFISMGLIFGRSLGGSGDTISPMIMTFIALFIVQVPLAFFLAYKTSFGIKGIWYAMFAANFFLGIMSVIWFQTGRWKNKKV